MPRHERFCGPKRVLLSLYPTVVIAHGIPGSAPFLIVALPQVLIRLPKPSFLCFKATTTTTMPISIVEAIVRIVTATPASRWRCCFRWHWFNNVVSQTCKFLQMCRLEQVFRSLEETGLLQGTVPPFGVELSIRTLMDLPLCAHSGMSFQFNVDIGYFNRLGQLSLPFLLTRYSVSLTFLAHAPSPAESFTSKRAFIRCTSHLANPTLSLEG